MEQIITQVKYTQEKVFSQNKESFVLCTLKNPTTLLWICEFKNMSLLDISKFIVDFFDSNTVKAEKLEFTINQKTVSVFKSSHKVYPNYLEDIARQINIG